MSYKDPEIIESLCRGHFPYNPTDHNTEVMLEGLFYDNSKWNESIHKADEVIVRVGNFERHRFMIHAGLKVCADPGL
jgi:hypothetical protein